MGKTTIVFSSVGFKGEMVCFEVVGERILKLLGGTWESFGEFIICKRGKYQFIGIHDWIEANIK